MSNVIITPEFVNLEAPGVSRALLEHIIAHADIIGQDVGGRPVMRFEFACEPWLLDKLAGYGAADEDREAEPDELACDLQALNTVADSRA